MMYMANLVKSAYEIKVQINTEVEDRLTKMSEDLDKKSRWIKRDLLEELEKIKINLQTDNASKIEDLTASLQNKLQQLEAMIRSDRADWVKAVDSDRAAIANLDSRVKILARQIKGDDAKPSPTVAAAEPPAPAAGNTPAAGTPAAAAPSAEPPPPSAAAKAAAAGAWLPDLGTPGR